MPWEVSAAIAETFLDTFSDFCVDEGHVKPPPIKAPIVGGTAIIEDPSTGQEVPVKVVLTPDSEAFHVTSLPAVGMFDPRENLVTISPTQGACKPRASWRNILLSVIRHELSHAGDPGFYREGIKNAKWQQAIMRWAREGAQGPAPSTQGLTAEGRRRAKDIVRRIRAGDYTNRGPQPQKNFCAYVRTPTETRAFLTQTATEIRLNSERMAAQKMKGFASPVEGMAAMSPTFREIAHCLGKQDGRKFLKMAAIAWEDGTIPRKTPRPVEPVRAPRERRRVDPSAERYAQLELDKIDRRVGRVTAAADPAAERFAQLELKGPKQKRRR